MIKIFKISIFFILSGFLLLTMFAVIVESNQNNYFGFDELNIWEQVNYWHDTFSNTWYSGQYGILLPQQNYLYGYGFQGISLETPWLLASVSGFAQSEFPNNINLVNSFINSLSYTRLIYSGLPFGCHPISEQKRCTSRGACHIPMYCPNFTSNYFWVK